jgi:hypothetical protein
MKYEKGTVGILKHRGDDMPISHAEISAIMIPLLRRCDADGRKHIASMAMAAALETYQPDERYRALDDAIQQFRLLLPHLE